MFRLSRTTVAAVFVTALIGGGALTAASTLSAAPLPFGGFHQAVAVSAVDANEPGLAVAPDGALYINAPSGLLSSLGPSFVWRSTDGGESWRPTGESLRRLLPGGGDSNLTVDPVTGALYLTDLWIGSATVAASFDQGVSWAADPVEGIVAQDRPWIATTGNGVVYHVTHQIPLGLVVSKSIDGGLTFPIQSVAASGDDQNNCMCPSGNLVAAHGSSPLGLADRVGVIYTADHDVKFARSHDGGLHFSNVVVHHADRATVLEDGFPVVATAGGRALVATWQETRHGTSTIWFSRSRDWGNTWDPAREIVGEGTSTYAWVAARGAKVVVTLFHAPIVATPMTMLHSVTWHETVIQSEDLGDTWSSLATVDPQPVKYGPICTDGLACLGNRQLGDFQTVAIDGNGRALATWARAVEPDEKRSQVMFARQ